MPSNSADRSSSHIAAAVSAPGAELAAAMSALPGLAASGNGDDLTTTAACISPAAAADTGDVTDNAPGVSGAYIYSYDSAGNPTLTDVGK